MVMLYIIVFLFSISIFYISYNIMRLFNRKNEIIYERLNSIAATSSSGIEDEFSKPLSERIIKPAIDWFLHVIVKFTPGEFVNSLENKASLAGNPNGLDGKGWLGVQITLIIFLPASFILFAKSLGMENAKLILPIVVGLILGFLIPNMILSKKITKRQQEILKSLPDVLDLLIVSVEAGLGLDGAISKVCEKMPGEISVLFDKVLQEIKIGKSRKEALRNMADKSGVQDLKSFVGAIIQAEQLGVSVSKVLRIQAEQIRNNRKQRIKEKAMKAPVKMIIPMIVFIFPSIFIILMGPVVLRLLTVF